MAYSSTNPPKLIAQTYGDSPGNIWAYSSTHTAAAAAASGFISNGFALGMKVGDSFRNVELTTAGAYTAFADGIVSGVTASSAATVTFAATST